MNRRVLCFGDSNTWGYDAGEFVQMNTLDYMHLDEKSHHILAKKLAEKLLDEKGW